MPINTVAPNARNGYQPTQPNHWVGPTYEYALVVRRDWHIVIWKRAVAGPGAWTSHDVSDTELGLCVAEDAHNGVAMAVDSLGYIHIAGNVHEERLRYIRSTNPDDITAWESGPRPDTFARDFTNLATNPSGVSLTGWASPDARFTNAWSAGGWSQGGSGRIIVTRSGSALDKYLAITRCGGTGMNIPVTAGLDYSATMQAQPRIAGISSSLHIIWRTGTTELSTSDGTPVDHVDANAIGRVEVIEATAPVGADNMIVELRVYKTDDSDAMGGATAAVGLLTVIEGTAPTYLRYFDGDKGNGLYDPNGTNRKVVSNWTGTANASTSVSSLAGPGFAGADSVAYPSFEVFSDGTLMLVLAQSTGEPLGRDITLWRLPAGETEWEAPVGVGVLMATPEGETGNEYNTDEVPDRSYRIHIHVDRHDVLHMVMVWRLYNSGIPAGNYTTSMAETFYVRSTDQGDTWTNVAGLAVETPFSWRDTLDGTATSASAAVKVAGVSVGAVRGGGFCIDRSGHPHFTVSHNGLFHVWWDGVAWQKSPLLSAFLNVPSLSYSVGSVWAWGYTKGTGKPGLFKGANLSKGGNPSISVAYVTTGTPGGAYVFEDMVNYSPALVHAGGTDTIYLSRFMIPDGDTPAYYVGGSGARFKAIVQPSESF